MNQHSSNLKCSLHNQTFEYFCEKCSEPICKQCTIIGPHNTPGHSIISLASAYERKIQQVKQRISVFVYKKGALSQQISSLSQQISNLQEKKQLGMHQNQRQQAQLMMHLQKSYDRIVNQIMSFKQEIQLKVNQINDLGHSFQTLQNPIEIIASHSSILQSLKECADRLELLQSKQNSYQQLPKVLSDLRLDLRYIEAYKTLISQKVLIVQGILQKMDSEILKIQRPVIDYQHLLKQLSKNMERCIEHNVCHFCGVFFDIKAANTLCPQNNSSLNINQFVGLCEKKPDSSKWATRHHYFGPPLDKYIHFKTSLSSTFTTQLNSIFLKLKTILIIKDIDMKQLFLESDKKKSSRCDRISMLYVLKQTCGLSEQQSQILLTISQKEKRSYDYTIILQRMQAK